MLKNVLKSLVGDAGNIIDNVVTTKEEKIRLKNEMKQMLLDSDAELQRNVTLYPHLIPHGFKVGNIDSKCMKIPMWDMDNQVWMDLERSTIINYIPQYKRS